MYRTLLLTGAVFLSIAYPALAMTDVQKKEIEGVVRQYILDNPEILFEASDRYQKKQEEAADAEAKKVLADRHDEFFKNPAYFVMGNPDAKTVFVEFFDYNCGYCKQAFKDLMTLTDRNKEIKFILIDTPILGPASMEAAKWSVAAGKLGKYVEFHKALMEFQGPKSEETLTKLAKDAGLDPVKVKEEAEKEDVMIQISKNMELFTALGLRGTPGFAAKDRVLRGFVGPEVLEQIAKELQTASVATPASASTPAK